MASQFQHRVVGAIVLVALTIIIIPGVFDGNKKYYQSEFAAIPLIPPQNNNAGIANNTLPPANQPIPERQSSVIPESVGNDQSASVVSTSTESMVTNPPPQTQNVNSTTQNKPTTSQPTVNQSKTNQQAEPKAAANPKVEVTKTVENNKPPKGQAYVIQVAALTNAAKVEEIKAKLSFANYSVFTIPSSAIQGKTTRIFVGPDASRQRLEASLPAIEKMTGLKGVIKEHKVTR